MNYFKNLILKKKFEKAFDAEEIAALLEKSYSNDDEIREIARLHSKKYTDTKGNFCSARDLEIRLLENWTPESFTSTYAYIYLPAFHNYSEEDFRQKDFWGLHSDMVDSIKWDFLNFNCQRLMFDFFRFATKDNGNRKALEIALLSRKIPWNIDDYFDFLDAEDQGLSPETALHIAENANELLKKTDFRFRFEETCQRLPPMEDRHVIGLMDRLLKSGDWLAYLCFLRHYPARAIKKDENGCCILSEVHKDYILANPGKLTGAFSTTDFLELCGSFLLEIVAKPKLSQLVIELMGSADWVAETVAKHSSIGVKIAYFRENADMLAWTEDAPALAAILADAVSVKALLANGIAVETIMGKLGKKFISENAKFFFHLAMKGRSDILTKKARNALFGLDKDFLSAIAKKAIAGELKDLPAFIEFVLVSKRLLMVKAVSDELLALICGAMGKEERVAFIGAYASKAVQKAHDAKNSDNKN